MFSFRESFPLFEMLIIVLSQPPFPEMLSNSSQHPCWSHQTSELNSISYSDLENFLPNKLDLGQIWIFRFAGSSLFLGELWWPLSKNLPVQTKYDPMKANVFLPQYCILNETHSREFWWGQEIHHLHISIKKKRALPILGQHLQLLTQKAMSDSKEWGFFQLFPSMWWPHELKSSPVACSSQQI
jgi:hypothetical protein